MMVAVLFVCLGNICRSPAAEGMLRHLAKNDYELNNLEIQSCGLGTWHLGQLPHATMQELAKIRGIILSSRAQLFQQNFFDQFDYILAADQDVLKVLYSYAKDSNHKAKIRLIMDYSTSYYGQDIPDPYYGNDASFELVLDMLEDACEGLIQDIKQSKK